MDYKKRKAILKEFLPDVSDDLLDELVKSQIASEKFHNDDERAIRLSCYHGLIDTEALEDIRRFSNRNQIQFKVFEPFPQVRASLEELFLDVFVLIKGPILIDVIVSGVTWDVTKYAILTIWRQLKSLKINRVSSAGVEKKQPSFGIKFITENRRVFDFHFSGEISDETMLKSLEQCLEHFSKENSKVVENSQEYEKTLKYSKDGKWIQINLSDVIAEHQQKLKKRKNKKAGK
jgi:hypothetical protein